MNAQHLRVALGFTNVLLMAGLGLLGYVTFVERHSGVKDRIPTLDLEKLKLPVKPTGADPVDKYRVIWDALEKPPPPPPPPTQQPPQPPPPPTTPPGIDQYYQLVSAASDGESKLCVLVPRGGNGEQVVIMVGDVVPNTQYTCTGIEKSGEGQNAVYNVNFKSPDGRTSTLSIAVTVPGQNALPPPPEPPAPPGHP